MCRNGFATTAKFLGRGSLHARSANGQKRIKQDLDLKNRLKQDLHLKIFFVWSPKLPSIEPTMQSAALFCLLFGFVTNKYRCRHCSPMPASFRYAFQPLKPRK